MEAYERVGSLVALLPLPSIIASFASQLNYITIASAKSLIYGLPISPADPRERRGHRLHAGIIAVALPLLCCHL